MADRPACATVDVFDVTDTSRMREARAIRTIVFVDEQGVPPQEEIDEHDLTDRRAVHVLARDGTGRAVGTARYYVAESSTVRIGRMAVLGEARGRGVGARLLRELVARARERGFARAHLHAQTHARDFYRKAGFHDDGERLWDAGILHQPMTLELA